MLFLWRPDENIFIKPDFFDRALELCGFNKLGRGQNLDEEQYRRVMHDMTSLRNRLDEDNLQVNDFIDVQSFLWVWDSNEKEKKNVETDDKNDENKKPVKQAQNVILYGPPGTGKTYTLRNEYFPQYTSVNETGDIQKRYEFITFHQYYFQ